MTLAPPNLVMRALFGSGRCPGSSIVYRTAILAVPRPRWTKGMTVCRAVVFCASRAVHSARLGLLGAGLSTRHTTFQSPPPGPHLVTTTRKLRFLERHTREQGTGNGASDRARSLFLFRMGAAGSLRRAASAAVRSSVVQTRPPKRDALRNVRRSAVHRPQPHP